MRKSVTSFSVVCCLASCIFLAGCTSLVESVVKEPITPDPTQLIHRFEYQRLKDGYFYRGQYQESRPSIEKNPISMYMFTMRLYY